MRLPDLSVRRVSKLHLYQSESSKHYMLLQPWIDPDSYRPARPELEPNQDDASAKCWRLSRPSAD